MKYEITKGSAEDFELQPDAVVAIYCINGSQNYLYSSMPSSAKLHENWLTCNFEVIAERRPITEPELKPIYGDGIHDDSDALQQRIDMGIDVSNIIGEQGNLFNISRPLQFKPITVPAWDGEGLPPVGVECEFTSYAAGDVWHAGVVRYLSEHTIVIEFTDMVNGKAESISHPRTMKFRPLRSPEDVARDEFIKKLSGNVIEGFSIGTKFAAALYDAGYRKME